MAIDPITGTSAAGLYSTTPTRAPKQEMDGEMFLHLLVTQLRNQDPSSPMDTNQMISQTTQLAMMEKMNELAVTGQEDFSLQMRIAAAAFVGKDVSYTDATGASVTGTASAVSFAGPVPVVTVGGVEIPLDLISGITAPSAH
jgi:flagellar basal-body rod modification protein FlgD